jgi:tRNA(Ile2) C34 agmatinyltransferase TiaS
MIKMMVTVSFSSLITIVIVIILTLFQFKVFNENIPQVYIIDALIIIAVFVLTNNILTERKNKSYLKCPECPNAKMIALGTWKCEKCGKLLK